ncbi:MAG: hypothetical protein ACYC33_10440 [Thermoleophilia bacterium]
MSIAILVTITTATASCSLAPSTPRDMTPDLGDMQPLSDQDKQDLSRFSTKITGWHDIFVAINSGRLPTPPTVYGTPESIALEAYLKDMTMLFDRAAALLAWVDGEQERRFDSAKWNAPDMTPEKIMAEIEREIRTNPMSSLLSYDSDVRDGLITLHAGYEEAYRLVRAGNSYQAAHDRAEALMEEFTAKMTPDGTFTRAVAAELAPRFDATEKDLRTAQNSFQLEGKISTDLVPDIEAYRNIILLLSRSLHLLADGSSDSIDPEEASRILDVSLYTDESVANLISSAMADVLKNSLDSATESFDRASFTHSAYLLGMDFADYDYVIGAMVMPETLDLYYGGVEKETGD